MDASAVRRMILSFEKKSLKNQEMRMKYPDNPERLALDTYVIKVFMFLLK